MEKVIIKVSLVSETEKSWLLDCEGDKERFPKSECEYSEKLQQLTAPVWLLEKKFPDEIF